MGFYQFFIIFICNTYLILFNAFTATADDSSIPDYKVTIKLPDGLACPGRTEPKPPCIMANALSSFALECSVDPSLSNEHTLAWYLGSKNRSEKESLIVASERIKLQGSKLVISPVEPNDARVYACRVVKKGSEAAVTQPFTQESVEVVVPPRVRTTPKEVVGIEENPIHLNCTVMTNVPVTVKWRVDNGVIKNEDLTASTTKYQLSGNDSTLLKDGMFTIKAANLKDDRGSYVCWAETPEFGKTSTNMTFNVRIKSKYAALWPFLGICAEVVILCVIILIYEKKRDKTELEESDTDQGPETKSSPDHVQDNVRYRK